MLHKQQRKCSTSLLELEAAEYFKLDLSQINLGPYDRRFNSNMTNRRLSGSKDLRVAKQPAEAQKTMTKDSVKRSRTGRLPAEARTEPKSVIRCANPKGSRAQDRKASKVARRFETRQKEPGRTPASAVAQKAPNSQCCGRISPLDAAGSSTTSTNSLPSITSSPSVSPSLVCPHLSLEDILDCGQTSSRSPHTIGLCPKCRLDPPPNIHSPLSPQFRPDSRSHGGSTSPRRITRGYSDQQASYCSVEQARRRQRRQQAAATEQIVKANSRTVQTPGRQQSDLGRLRDDSLDFYLELSELKRMQMSPTMRNSVEFIRRNSIESARVVRIFKNGQPFEKPLRVCLLRGEFSTLNHLLDHINSRLLIPLGARYLFHLDGQLVYSVHELKHGSAYVVSGSRAFDYRTSEILKEQQRREQLAKVQQEQRAQNRQRAQSGSNTSKSSSRDDLRQGDNQEQTKPVAETRPKRAESKRPLTFRQIEPRSTIKSGRSQRLMSSEKVASGEALPASDRG